jgi:PPOX class probable F420-dependent enzyme
MTKTELDDFLNTIRIGTLCSLNADGSPNALPLWYDWDGEKIRMFSTRDTGKVRRLAEDPRASLSVAEPVGKPEAWVTVEGTVEILDEGGLELACRLATLYYQPDQAQQTIAAWTAAGNRVLLELTPTRIRSDCH